MALVFGGKSSLNPDAPIFIPASVRQVEDFSPEWWELINTAAWFRDYWLSHHQGENSLYGNVEDEFDDVLDLLPDSVDLGVDDNLLNMEEQFEEFIQFSESGGFNGNGMAVDVGTKAKTLSLSRSFNKAPSLWNQQNTGKSQQSMLAQGAALAAFNNPVKYKLRIS